MQLIRIVCASLALITALPLAAQQSAAPADNFEILRAKVKADKKFLVASNMDLTVAEAERFWPVYEDYQRELQTLTERMSRLLLAYAGDLREGTLSDATATGYVRESIAIEEGETALRKRYLPRLAKALPGRKVARYLQIENKIRAVTRFDIADTVPLVPTRDPQPPHAPGGLGESI